MGLLQKAGTRSKSPTGTPAMPRRGFLDKAESFRASDEIERMCIERLTRLATASGTPYTALTVLKAYFPAIAELILKKVDGAFQICDTVGITDASGCEKEVALPILNSELPVEGYYPIPISDLWFESLSSDCRAFAFPVYGDLSVIGYLLFITKVTDYAVLSAIRRIVGACPKKFIIEKESIKRLASAKKADGGITADIAAENGIQALGESHVLICRLASSVVDVPQETLKQLAQSRLGNSGIAFTLTDNRLCIFLKSTLDRELYAHQFAKSIRSALSLSAEDFSIIAQGQAAGKLEALAIINSQP